MVTEMEVIERKPVLEPWPGPWAKWAKNYCNANLWRVAYVLGNDMEDAMAECALVFVECSNRYGAKVNSPQQMMALYKLCVISWFNTLSVKDSRGRGYQGGLSKDEPAIQSEAELAVTLSEASTELQEVMSIFTSAPVEIMNTLRTEASSHCPKQFFRAVLRHLGINPVRAVPLERELQELLS